MGESHGEGGHASPTEAALFIITCEPAAAVAPKHAMHCEHSAELLHNIICHFSAYYMAQTPCLMHASALCAGRGGGGHY